jgi:hypothetical protein
MSYGVGPHDYGCDCWRCQSRRLAFVHSPGERREVQVSQLTDKLDDLVSETTKRMNEHKVMLEALREIAAYEPARLSHVASVARRALRFVEGEIPNE